MGPSKFVAPLKKTGGQSSLSSSFSSSGSLGNGNKDVKAAEVQGQVVQVQSEPYKDANFSGFKSPSESSKTDATDGLKQADTSDQEISKLSKSSDEPLQKKRKIDSAASSSNATVCSADNLLDENKENIRPKSKKPDKAPTKPCVSLTDEEYERIFTAVLGKQGSDIPLGSTPGKTDACLDHSKDMFEFSQSDLDDSEGEQSESTLKKDLSVKGKDDNSVVNQNSSGTKCNEQLIGENSGLDNTSSCIITSVLDKVTDGTQEVNTQSQTSASQENLTNVINPDSKPQTEDSQGSSVIDFDNLCTSTPLVEKGTPKLNSDACVTPQKLNYTQVLGLSQEQNRSPASCVIKSTSASQRSQVLEPIASPLQTSRTPTKQSLLLASSPTSKQPLLSQTPHSSQGFITPTCTPTRTLAIISKNSDLLLKTPTNSAPNTPGGSQQISQEICVTPPPANKTAKERLLWLQKKRLAGLWVQCDERECQKWRYLPDSHDPTTLPEKWFCRMHPDEEFNNCDAPERRLSLHAEEDMIYNRFSPGSLVRAKLSGYPWWPAMVEDDPDLEQFFWLNEFSDIPTWYHVVFFDDESKTRSRAWVQVERLQKYHGEPSDNESVELVGYQRRLLLAEKQAHQAKSLSCEERLARFSFASCYKGAIGGYMKRQYSGPLGFRQPASNVEEKEGF